MKKYLVKVNGQELEVEVVEIGQAATAPTEAKQVSSSPKPAKPRTASAGGGEVLAPMPGNIIEILVEVGDTVTEDDPVVTLEAMKMENEIAAGKAGQVKEIFVCAGQNVPAGEVLMIIE